MEISDKKALKSEILKCGKRTFFFDLHLASNNKKYIKITESTFVAEGQDRKRNTFLLFPEDLEGFQSKLATISGNINLPKIFSSCLYYVVP